MRTQSGGSLWVHISSVLVCLVATGVAHAQIAVDIDPTFARYGIQVLGYPDSQAELTRLLGAGAVSTLGPALPYLLVVTNTATSPITVVVARYPRIDSSDKPLYGDMVYRFGQAASSPQELIIAPEAGLTRMLNTPTRSVTSAAPGLVSTISGELFNPGRVKRTTVSLDSVAFADGRVVGPDRLGFISREQRKAAAAGRIVAKIEDTSVSDTDLIAWLRTFDVHKVTDGDPALLYEASFASMALKVLQQQGRQPAARGMGSIVANLPEYRHVN